MRVLKMTGLMTPVIFFLAFAFSLSAQVGIGENTAPESFIALKVSSTTGGVRYPQVTAAKRTALTTAIGSNTLAYGLMIYNTGSESLEYYRGAGTPGWFNLDHFDFRSASSSSVAFEGNSVIDTEELQASSNGYVKEFILNLNNFQNIESIEVGKYLDFKNVIKNVKIPDELSSTNKIQIEFYPKVMELVKGRTEANPLMATLYATYVENGKKNQVKFKINVIDSDLAENSGNN